MTSIQDLSTELLESILLELDPRTLLTSAQRVCRVWHTVVDKSLPLQRVLFYEPICSDAARKQSRRLNPLLVQAFPPFFSDVYPPDQSEFKQPVGIFFSPLSSTIEKTGKEILLYPKASWRRMLIQQPPVQGFAVIQASSGRIGKTVTRYTVPIEKQELRMNVLYDLVIQKRVALRVMWRKGCFDRLNYERSPCDRLLHETLLTCDIILYSHIIQQCSIGSLPGENDRRLRQKFAFPVSDWGRDPKGSDGKRLNVEPDINRKLYPHYETSSDYDQSVSGSER